MIPLSIPRRDAGVMSALLSRASAIVLVSFLVASSTTALAQEAGLSERLAACATCHGERGEGIVGSQYYPHLAGKPAGYLLQQLQGYRDGRRTDAQMVWLLQFMDDAYMAEIAQFYAAQPPRTRAADTGASKLSQAMRVTAEKLVADGDPARDLPACASCHGSELTGLEPAIPALVGLPADYLIAQLNHWRHGTRRASAPDCMADIANALSAEEIRAVAQWLSQQSHADGRPPAPEGSFTPSRRCGNLAHAETTP